MNHYLGFDPGGGNTFGWAVSCDDGFDTLDVLATGCAAHALQAVEEALKRLPQGAQPAAAGIDAPLFWTTTGARRVDKTVRGTLRMMDAPSPGGTVQQLNSLRGACLVQGVAAAVLLRQQFPQIKITETHPKALLWHLRLARAGRRADEVSAAELPGVRSVQTLSTEHERDAVISCYAAWSLHRQRGGWRDLAELEQDAIYLLPGPVSYWMPTVPENAMAPL